MGVVRESRAGWSAAETPGLVPAPITAGFLVTLTTCMGIGPLLIYGLTALSPLVIADLGLTRVQFGSLATTAFTAAALTSGVVGRVVDERSERVTLVVLFVGAGLALVLAAMAHDYLAVVTAVILSGAAQALSNPVTNRLVTTYAAPGGRGLLMGIKQSGVQMAQLVAALTLPSLALWAGWRGAVGVMAVLALIGMAVAWRAVPRPVRSSTELPRNRPAPLPRIVWWLTAHALLTGAALQAVNVYLPLYGYEELELAVPAAALTAAVIGGVGLVARIAWGRRADQVSSPVRPLLWLSLLAAVGVLAILLAGVYNLTPLVWVGAVIFGASGIAANVVLMVAVVRAVPFESTGRASGVLAIGLYLGFASGPLAFGALVDGLHDYTTAWSVVCLTYLLTACLVAAAGFVRRPSPFAPLT